jgi:hypothetical protein
MEHLSDDRRSVGQDLNMGSAAYEARVLTIQL